MKNRNDRLFLDNLNDVEQNLINQFLEINIYNGDSVVFRAWSVGESALLDGYYDLQDLKIIVQILEIIEKHQESNKEKTNDN